MSAVTAALRLVLSENGQYRAEFAIEGEQLRIGRRPFNEIALDDLTVSGEHALIQIGPGGCLIRDLNSRNGTYVNGRAVVERLLCDGDTIDIGVYRLRLHAATPAEQRQDREAQPVPDGKPAGAPPPAMLEYLAGVHAGVVQRLERPITRIGDGSTHSAVVARRKSGFVLTPLEGMVPARLNGQACGPGAAALVDGDLIELGEAQIRFRLPA